jgi:hypothetical protein
MFDISEAVFLFLDKFNADEWSGPDSRSAPGHSGNSPPLLPVFPVIFCETNDYIECRTAEYAFGHFSRAQFPPSGLSLRPLLLTSYLQWFTMYCPPLVARLRVV